MTLTIDKFGRVLIPKAIRQSVGLEPGDELIIELTPNAPIVTLTIKPKPSDIEVTYTDWGFPLIEGGGPFTEDFDTVDFLKEGHDEYHKSRFGA